MQTIQEATKQIIGLYDDVNRNGLADTPARVARAYEAFLNPEMPKMTTFPVKNYNEIVISRDISFFSLCEHHILPFFGKAYVAYIPNEKILGLSKLARAVDYYARRFQIQERMGAQIAGLLMEVLEPQGVGVVLRARHLCQEMRGIKKEGVETITLALRGCFKDPATRREFNELWKE
jgi:GTP cyclohydrolase I